MEVCSSGIHTSRDQYWKNFFFLKKTTLWPLFMDGVQLPQGYIHFEEAVVLISLYKTSTNLVNNKKLPVVTGSLQGFKKLSENITMFHSC